MTLRSTLPQAAHDAGLERFAINIAELCEMLGIYWQMTEEEEMKLADVSLAPTKGPNVSAIGQLGALMATAMAEQDVDDNAQSILEEHVSRVWDNSAGQTPSRSPGRSPDRAALLRRGVPSQLAGPSTNVSASNILSRSLPHHPPSHKRKDKDLHFSTSMLSFDSGVGAEDKSSAVHMDPADSSIYRHHHHYHHHHKPSRPQFMDVDTPRRGLQYHVTDSSVRDSNTSWEDPNRSRSRDNTKRLNAKKTPSDCNIDSGVSLYDASPVQVPNLHDPTNEKVLAWMLENEKVGSSNTQYSTDNSDKSSSHKRSHKSAANSSRSKKPQGQYHSSSRSASLDRSFQGVDYHSSHVQPAQPFIQDPSMPLLNPPNPTTQLEEARRRLEDEKRRMMKSQSFAGATTKDRKNMPPPSYAPPRSLPLTGKSIPSANASMDLSAADESHSSSSSRSDRKSYSSKKVLSSSSAPTTPATSDVTVVGYYFCGEPIPYRSTVPGKTVTLAQFKSLITKKGNYKYFFKKASDEFDSGVILEEVTNDNDELPLWEGKVVGKVEKVES